MRATERSSRSRDASRRLTPRLFLSTFLQSSYHCSYREEHSPTLQHDSPARFTLRLRCPCVWSASGYATVAARTARRWAAGTSGNSDHDRWGVPHIYAANHRRRVLRSRDFNAARGRLFQIDLWRTAWIGPVWLKSWDRPYVEHDKAARLFLYRGDMAKEWAAYGTDAQSIADLVCCRH